MADPQFEDQLDALFEIAPAFDDADLFAARLDARLERQGLRRRVALSVAAALGGGVALAEVVTSGVGQRLAAMAHATAGLVQDATDKAQGLASAAPALHGLTAGEDMLRTAVAGAGMHWILLAGAVVASLFAIQSNELA